MPINFIVNDPLAADPAAASPQKITPSVDRPGGKSGIAPSTLPAQALYASGTAEFVAWQAREAALRAIVAVEAASGALPGWTGKPSYRKLPLIPVAGQDLNAYYDRASISFFVTRVAGQDVYSGASTDVVAHEAGHAILDAIRPDLWGVNMMEVGAFHEGFGDIVAILTALSDKATRVALLAIGLRKANHVEGTAEDLSEAIRKIKGPSHSASAPRRALNTFKWSFPTSLPPNGPPSVLINEEHSLGRLASGVFYDLICEIHAAKTSQGEAALWSSAKEAMDLTMRAAAAVSVKPRFFDAWGRTMATIDATSFNGKYAVAITTAFANHGFMVGSTNILAPRFRLSAVGTRRTRSRSLVTPGTKSFVRSALGVASGQRLQQRAVEYGGTTMVEMSVERAVDLTGLSERLSGVRTMVWQPALVGEVGEGPAVLGAIDPAIAISEEVRAYVATLLTHQSIAFSGKGKKGIKSVANSASGKGVVAGSGTTHVVVSKGGEKVLERKSFTCGCTRH